MAQPLTRLVTLLARLPGIGPKSATRLAHHLLRVSDAEARELAQAIVEIKEKLFHCSVCRSITAVDPCELCTDPAREKNRLCVVEEPWNIQPIERTREYRGLYHVLLGHLSPQRGIGPDQLAVAPLLSRLDGVAEVILATNPSVEGEATALYLAQALRPLGVRISRIASGLPHGGELEFADQVTVGRAFEGRRDL